MTDSPAPPLAVAVARAQVTARAWALLTLLCCIFGFCLRWLNASADLGSPGVDENDIVEQAVAFMGGQWRYYLPEYGPLPMYLLAALYHLVAALRGLSPLDYAARVFFDGQEQYWLARLFCAACYLPLAVCSYRFLAPRYGRCAAFIAAVLLSLPLLDQLTKSTVRIDVPQGAFQLGALLLLALAMESGRWRHWLCGGLCAGLSMACKPLPGLLVAPCFLAASWFAASGSDPLPGASSEGSSGSRRLLLRGWRTLARPALWAAGAVALAAALLANPSALDLKQFVRAQTEATAYYSGPNAPGLHLTAFEALRGLRVPLLLSAGLSMVAMVFVRDARAKLLALFPLVYATAFWGRPVRAYYMVAPAMVGCLVIAICIGSLIERTRLLAGESSARGTAPVSGARPGASGLLAPALALGFVLLVSWVPVGDLQQEKRQLSRFTLAREWIYAHIPSGARLFHYGAYASGPRLVAAGVKQAGEWGEFFEYGRDKYAFYKDAFRKAYAEYRAQGRPVYDIAAHGATAQPAAKTKPWLSRSLARRALKEGRDYIILAGFRTDDYRQLGYSWFDEVEVVEQFDKIVIFRVRRPEVVAPLAAPPPAAPAPADSASRAQP